MDKGLLVKGAVVTSLFLDFEQNEKTETTHPLSRRTSDLNYQEATQLHHPLHHMQNPGESTDLSEEPCQACTLQLQKESQILLF